MSDRSSSEQGDVAVALDRHELAARTMEDGDLDGALELLLSVVDEFDVAGCPNGSLRYYVASARYSAGTVVHAAGRRVEAQERWWEVVALYGNDPFDQVRYWVALALAKLVQSLWDDPSPTDEILNEIVETTVVFDGLFAHFTAAHRSEIHDHLLHSWRNAIACLTILGRIGDAVRVAGMLERRYRHTTSSEGLLDLLQLRRVLALARRVRHPVRETPHIGRDGMYVDDMAADVYRMGRHGLAAGVSAMLTAAVARAVVATRSRGPLAIASGVLAVGLGVVALDYAWLIRFDLMTSTTSSARTRTSA